MDVPCCLDTNMIIMWLSFQELDDPFFLKPIATWNLTSTNYTTIYYTKEDYYILAKVVSTSKNTLNSVNRLWFIFSAIEIKGML